MNNFSLLNRVVVGAGIVLLTGCIPQVQDAIDQARERALNRGGRIELNCQFDAMFSGSCGTRIRSGVFVSAVTDEIDVALGGVLVEAAGAVVTASNAPVTVNLFLNGQLIAANSFTYSKNDQMLKFDQPNAVNAWVNSYSGQYDMMESVLTGLQVVSGGGQNSLVVTEVIGPFNLISASQSWNHPPVVDDTVS